MGYSVRTANNSVKGAIADFPIIASAWGKWYLTLTTRLNEMERHLASDAGAEAVIALTMQEIEI